MEEGREGSDCRYTLPGILHFLQHEWSRFELERAQWEAEKAELQAKIAFLQGERRGQENLKRDLIRRIKMLEFALKKERNKVSKLKGQEPGPEPVPPENCVDSENSEVESGLENGTGDQATNDLWAGGRQLLRQYLQEVGFTDTILDARSARLRALLGASAPNDDDDDEDHAFENGVKGEYLSESGGVALVDDVAIKDDEVEQVLDEFNFLGVGENDAEWNPNKHILNEKRDLLTQQQERRRKRPPPNNLARKDGINGDNDGLEKNQSKMLANNFGNNNDDSEAKDIDDEDGEADELELGVLAGLTVANEADPLGLSDNSQLRRTWSQKYTLKSHLDGVRSVRFHPTEPLVVSASEDQLVKVWNLTKTGTQKKNVQIDMEPIMNYRGHDGAVLSVAWGQHECFSAGLDGNIFAWPIPKAEQELYDPWEKEILGRRFIGHSDAVWNLDIRGDELLSTSADGSVKLWNVGSAEVKASHENEKLGIPISAQFTPDEGKIVTGWTGEKLTVVDLETGKTLVVFDDCIGVNSVASHPTLPVAVTAHEDHHIRFWDLSSGLMVHQMVAHNDAVTTIAVDPNGLYLLSGSHDASIRLWGFESRTCVQEMTAHRPKFNEAVHSAAFHSNKGYVASAGADGLIKIFV